MSKWHRDVAATLFRCIDKMYTQSSWVCLFVFFVIPCFHWSILLVLQASEKSHLDDNGSEASAETNTVDSGKGSSVSDVMSRDLGKHLIFELGPFMAAAVDKK